ncbi:MAG: hypothetical protein N2Z80_00375 [Hydrogenothermaceae bacterium]|nr:hypothetical protein [Hydrogenothermaceae bacterium]
MVESKIIKQEMNREEINRLKLKISELEKNQKYILDFLSQGKESNSQSSMDIECKLDQIILYQKDIESKLDKMEKDTKRYLLPQSIIQFLILDIFFVLMILLYKYKRGATVIENKIYDVSSKMEDNKRETLKLLMEKAKDDPRLALAVKNFIEEEKGGK